ncbi:MAG: transposase [Ignavibacteria bacterium]|nr:transposase [Ignavibacteria bacterium]
MPFKKYKSLRLKEYNYSQPGVYFVTICTKDRKCLFGEISGDEMILNEAGIIAQNEIVNIPGHYHNIEIGENIVMPNHIHMVAYIYDLMGVEQTVTPAVSESGVGQAATPTKNIRLQDVIGSYKSGVTREIRKINGYENFKWQRYFHDHVVRTDRALENISDYIRLNPMKWAEDIENELYITGITDKTRTNKAKTFYRNLTI